MLGQTDLSFAGNEIARAMIAFMLMNMLDGKKNDSQEKHLAGLFGAAMLMNQAAAAAGVGAANLMALTTRTAAISISRPVPAAYAQQSYQAAGNATATPAVNATA
jgi:hypothetical protein